jgi:hypothetical protein
MFALRYGRWISSLPGFPHYLSSSLEHRGYICRWSLKKDVPDLNVPRFPNVAIFIVLLSF